MLFSNEDFTSSIIPSALNLFESLAFMPKTPPYLK
jgi:hypothetical protein